MTCHDSENQIEEQKDLKWWQLSLIGIGCTIGTGFFLGSSIGIKLGGLSIVFMLILAGFTTYIVFEALAKMTIADPQKGSFRTYSRKAFGHWAGFCHGWTYWSSELLIMGSQLSALGIFSRYWFPNIPLWIFISIYGIAALMVIFIGIKAFERLENWIAIIKVIAIIGFIIIAIMIIFGLIHGGFHKPQFPKNIKELSPKGLQGSWSSLIYAFYAFGGIEIMGLMATRLKEPKDSTKSGKVMLLLLTIIYILSIGLAIIMVPLHYFNMKESPFVVALQDYNLPYIPFVFNVILILAGFSTLVGSLFAVNSVLINLAEEGDAPALFAKKGKRNISFPALILIVIGLGASIITALLLPKSIYEYITTAASLMLLYTWVLILLSFRKLMNPKGWEQLKSIIGLMIIVLAISGTIFQKTVRFGFMVSFLFLGIIIGVTIIMHFLWKKKETV
ncbi:amino acid permease [Bacillus bingmayongensis]|uniref:amino acid permease n=1 Tax=Bacillus bingmayongensis TaxID=1150157 RepID=UPI00030BD15F|nr:amino acid permease [Bacillus bingmayongensis]